MKSRTIFTLVFSSLFLLSYFLIEPFLKQIWLLAYIPVFVFGTGSLIFFILEIVKKSKIGIFFCLFILLVVIANEIFQSDILKSKVILKAHLEDDLPRLDLILREDNTFEMISTTMFSENIREGVYEFEDGKIIFKNKAYDNDFIPDTITIVNDTIYLKFNSNGKPIASFANYFLIDKKICK